MTLAVMFLCVLGCLTYLLRDKKASRWIFIVMYGLSGIFLFVILLDMTDRSGDAAVYAEMFRKVGSLSLFQAVLRTNQEAGFVILTWIVQLFTDNYNYYRIVLLLVELVVMLAAFQLLDLKYPYLILTAYLWYVFYLAYIIAALRQGLAMHVFIFMVAYYYYCFMKKKAPSAFLSFLLVLIMVLFHKSSIIIAPLVLYMYFNTKSKTESKYLKHSRLIIVLVTFLCVLLFRKQLQSYLTDEFKVKGEKYTTEVLKEKYGREGIRFDFMFYNFMPAVFAFYMVRKRKIVLNPLHYTYLYTSLIYLPFSSISYSDRIAAYTFFQVPLFSFYHIQFFKKKSIVYSVLLTAVIIGVVYLTYWPAYYGTQGYGK